MPGFRPVRLLAAPLLTLLLALAGTTATAAGDAVAAGLEGIGADMGYRMYGDAKKNRPLLLQNSRPHPVEVFDEGRGVFVAIPPYSDLEFACRGKGRKLNVRYRDAFREDWPFQVIIECGRELQFIAPQQVAPPRPVEPPPQDVGPVPEAPAETAPSVSAPPAAPAAPAGPE